MSPLTFADWQQLSPVEAARLVHQRAAALPPGQQRAALASLASEEDLADQLTRADRTGPLGGIPYFLKDLFDAAGLPTFAGSNFLPEVRPAPGGNGHMVQTLKAAGAVLAGKTHLHEFAFGITGENPHYGDCEHPRFPGRTSGGSSSGSAVAVAAGLAPLGIGTDTGGSIRVPSGFCGLFGFRTVPHHPWIADGFPLAHSFDTAGWFTANASDMQLTLTHLLGLTDAPVTPRGCWLELPGLDPEISETCRAAAAQLAPPADSATRDALLHAFAGAADLYAVLGASEAWSVHHTWAERYRDRYDPVVWQRLERARNLTSAQIETAQTRREVVRGAWADYFRVYDFLVLPATPCVALTKASCDQEHRTRILSLTTPASLAGLPALALPITLPSGLSTALQIVGPALDSPAFLHALRPWSA